MSAQQTFRNTAIVILTLVSAYILYSVAISRRAGLCHFYRRRWSGGLGGWTGTDFHKARDFAGLPGDAGRDHRPLCSRAAAAVNRLGGYIENDNRLAAKLISANTWAKPR